MVGALAIGQVWVCRVSADEPTRRIELTIAATHSTRVPWVEPIANHFVPEVNRRLRAMSSAVRVDWIEAYGGSLYKWQNSLEAMEIGLAEIGWVGTLWESSKMPLQNITYSLPFITDDLAVLLRVINRLHQEIPALREAWGRHNQIFLGGSGVDTYHLLTTFPVKTLDDLRGRKILAPGASSVWLKGTGAVAVDGALSTYYTQLKTGVAEGTLSILTGAYPYRIHEVAPYVTLVGIGAQCTGALTANADSWAELPADLQAVLAALGVEYTEQVIATVRARHEIAAANMRKDGAIFSTLGAKEKQRWIAALPDLATQWVERNEARGLPAREMLVRLMDGLRAEGVTPMHAWDEAVR
jgi:TRAP-type C4-dicarboxylate transport system substrate-binding protein